MGEGWKMIKRNLFLAPAFLLILVAIYIILTTSPNVRYWADDFCAAIPLRNSGFWGSQIDWWNGWTGRYSYIFFLNIFESLGVWSAKVLPVLLFILLVISLIPVFFFEILLAPLFVVLALVNAPNLIQSFYWQVGSLNYTAEFIFFNLFLSLLVWPKKKFALPLAFLLPIVAGGFSESFALTQIVLIGSAVLILFVADFKDRAIRIKLGIAGLVGSVFSVLIMLMSPGNTARSQLVDTPESMMFVFKSTLLGTKWYLTRMLAVAPFVATLLLLFSAIFITVKSKWKLFRNFYAGPKRTFSIMTFSVLAGIFSCAAVIFSGYYATAYTPPERTMFIAIYAILASFVVFSFAVSILIIKFTKGIVSKYLYWLALLIYLTSSLYLFFSFTSHWRIVRSELEEYAISWDREEAFLRGGEGGRIVEIKNIKPVGGLDGFIENKGWVLGCVRQLYNLKEIRINE
jgi:hypothetical protein